MTSSVPLITELRLKLFANGYSPIPVTSPDPNDPQAGKKPAIRDWSNSNARNAEEIAAWAHRYPNAGNTGVVCGRLVAVDIDVDDQPAAERILEAILDSVGLDAPVRFGRAPRALILCRTKTPMKKRASKEFILPNGLAAKVEILGEGQQCVVDGIHPKTGSAYLWKDGSPMTTAYFDLPEVGEGQLSTMLARSEDILRDIGAQPRETIVKQEAVGKEHARYSTGPVDPSLVGEALECIPNDDADYDFWLRIGFALHDGLGAAGFRLWNEWSKKSKKHDDAFTGKTWSYFKHGGGVSIGSLFFHAFKNGWRKPIQADERPVVRVVSGCLHEAVDAAEQALLDSKVEVFQRGGVLVRPVRMPRPDSSSNLETLKLLTVSEDWLNESFMRVATFQKVKGDTGEVTTVNCPPAIVKAYLARIGEWRVPLLNGLVHAPTLRGNGTVIASPGFDRESCLYADFDPASFAQIPNEPNRADALKALNCLKSFLATFPFLSEADRSVAIASILTGVVRHLFPTAPLFGFSAPVAGSGKSLLVDLVSIIVTGQPAAVLSPGKTEEELEKRLGAAFIQGATIISLDNCTEPVNGAFLCQALTQSRVQMRLLGQSKNVEILTNALMFATGNNLAFAEDMTRRVMLCSLDSGVERPEERQFDGDILQEARVRRGELVAAALTILRSFWVRSTPPKSLILGSFAEWSNLIRGALIWLDQVDPAQTMARVRENDPELERNLSLINEIQSLKGSKRFIVAELVRLACERHVDPFGEKVLTKPELHAILKDISGSKEILCSQRIGKALAKMSGRIYGSRRLIRHKPSGGKVFWQLVGV